MEAIAKTRHLKGSPRKARLVIDLIRGVNVSRALAILKFTDKRAAEPIAKTLRSAIANATYLAEQQNIAIDPDDLWVKTCFVDMGAHKNRRRMRPAPQGRAYREQRHYCHITIEVSSEAPAQKESDKPHKKSVKATESVDKKTKSTAKTEQVKEKKSVKKDGETSTAEPKKEKKAKVEKPETETVVETTATETVVEETPFENKPLAAQTDEEKTGSKPAADAQIAINEELERQ